MSIRLSSLVWDSDAYQGNTLLTLLKLCDWANDDGERLFPRIATLAKRTRQSVRSVQNCLRALEADEVLIPVPNGRGGRSNLLEYKINVERVQNLHPPRKGAKSGTKRVQSTTIKGANNDRSPTPPYIDNRQVNHQVNRQEDADDSAVPIPDPKIVEHAITRICEILGVRLQDDPERVRWPVVVSRMLMDGLDLQKHIIPAAEVARGAGIFKLSYIRQVAFNISTGKTNVPGFSDTRRPASLSAHSAFTLGAAMACGVLDDRGNPIDAAGRADVGDDRARGQDPSRTIEGKVTARG